MNVVDYDTHRPRTPRRLGRGPVYPFFSLPPASRKGRAKCLRGQKKDGTTSVDPTPNRDDVHPCVGRRPQARWRRMWRVARFPPRAWPAALVREHRSPCQRHREGFPLGAAATEQAARKKFAQHGCFGSHSLHEISSYDGDTYTIPCCFSSSRTAPRTHRERAWAQDVNLFPQNTKPMFFGTCSFNLSRVREGQHYKRWSGIVPGYRWRELLCRLGTIVKVHPRESLGGRQT